MAEGSSHPLLTQTLLKSIDIIVPSEQQIFLFNSFIENGMKKIKFNLTQIGTLEKMRDTLLPKLMSGEVQVSV
jgi:type I restriction enzyme S subunit